MDSDGLGGDALDPGTGQGRVPPGPGPAAKDLLDASRCPVCGAALTSPLCGRCGVDLSGSDGARLWEVSQEAARLLTERAQLLDRLAATAEHRRRGVAAAPASATSPPLTAPPLTAPPLTAPSLSASSGPADAVAAPFPPPATVAPSLLARIGVQGLLVSLGALLVAVAGIVFLVFAWDRLSLGGRALVVAALTLAAMAGAAWLRPRLPETAEGVGAIATVLVIGDAWAVRATGLFGADRWTALGYTALAAAGCSVVLLAWAVLGRVRVGSLVGSVLAPLAVVLGGVRASSSDVLDHAAVAGLGLLAASALTAAGALAPDHWRAERRLLRWVGVGAWLLAVLGLPVWMVGGAGVAVLVPVGAAAVAVLHLSVHLSVPAPPSTSGRGWSFGAGAALALAVVPGAWWLVDRPGVGGEPMLAAVPVGAAAVALLVRATCGRGRVLEQMSHAWSVRGARGIAVLAAVPAAAVLVLAVQAVLDAAVRPWRSAVADPLAQALPALDRLVLDSAVPGWAAAGLVGAGAVLLLGRPVRWALPAVPMVAAGLLLAPLAPRLPLGAAAGILVALGLAAGVLGRRAVLQPPGWLPVGTWRSVLVGQTAIGLAAAALAVAVPLSWTARLLSVPVTLLAATAALMAAVRLRPVLPERYVAALPGLVVIGVAGAATGVGALPAMVRGSGVARQDLLDARAAGVAAVLLGAVLAGLPGPAGAAVDFTRERAAGFLTALGVAAVPVAMVVSGEATSWGSGARGPGQASAWALLTCAAFLLLVVVAALHPVRPDAPAGELAPLLGAALVPVAVVVTAAAPQLARFGADWRDVRLYAAGAVMVCALLLSALGVLSQRRQGGPAPDRRVLAAELGTAVPLLVLCLPLLSAEPRTDRQVWLVPMLLGVAATALALPPGRRLVAWLGLALLSASNALRLLAGGVETVEAYTLPPALALLAVTALRLRLVRGTDVRSTLLPGLSLVALPSLAAVPTGAWQRPAALIALGGLAVVANRWLDHRVRVAVAVAGALSAGAAGLLRAAGPLADEWAGLSGATWRQVEVWTLPAAAVLLVAGVLWLRADAQQRSWRPLAPGIVVLLGPSLLAVLDGRPVWRVGLVAVLAGAIVAVGAMQRLQAPVLLGAAALAVHAVAQLAPWVARVISGGPRWVPLAVVGLALLVLGATYEKRLRELRMLQVRVASLR